MQRKYFDIHTSLGRKSVWDERFPRDPETLIKDMAYYRIHGSLFIQNEGMEYSLIQGNRKGIETAEKYKGLYLAATMIPAMKYEWDEPFEYDILNQEKVKAVHIAPKSVRHLFTPKAMEKLCLTMQSKDLPLILSITQTDWSELERFLDAYPSVNVILTDTAWSHNRYLFSLLGRYKNLHFDISSNQSNDILEVTKQYFGIERALFGSDYPFKVMGGLKALVEYARLSEEEKDAVACGNACRLLHIDEKDLELYRGEPDFDEAASLVDQGKPLTSYYIIDAHAHMSGDGIYTLSDLVMKNGDAKSMVRTMDELGIDCTITVPWEGISVNGTNANKTCQKAMSDFPGRFLSYASLNPNYREELETVIPEFHEKDKGFVGIKPYYPKHGLDILDEKYKEWYEYANKRKLLMLLHTGSSSIYPKIPKLCETYPDIAILLAHSGSSYPNADFMIDVAKRYKNAYLEITYTSLTRGIIEYMVEKVGADKVLFGTDTPMRDPAPQLAWVAYSRISIEDKRKILGGNMKKLLERIERD